MLYWEYMTKQITTNDIFELLQDFMKLSQEQFERIEERFDRIEGRLDKVEGRLDKLEEASRAHTAAIAELAERIDRIDLQLTGLDDDIKYLYKLIESLKRDLKRGTLADEEIRSRLEEVEALAKRLCIKAGI